MGHGDPSTGQGQGQASGTSTTFLSAQNSFCPKVLHTSLYKNPAHAGKRVTDDWRKLFADEEVQGVSAAGGEDGDRDTGCAAISPLCPREPWLIPGFPRSGKPAEPLAAELREEGAVCFEGLKAQELPGGSGVGMGTRALSRVIILLGRQWRN